MGLAPTTPRKARLLLKEGKAVIEHRQPFTIRLKYKTGCASEHLKCGVDTGSQHIGTSLILPECKRVLDKSEYKLRSTMEKRTKISENTFPPSEIQTAYETGIRGKTGYLPETSDTLEETGKYLCFFQRRRMASAVHPVKAGPAYPVDPAIPTGTAAQNDSSDRSWAV